MAMSWVVATAQKMCIRDSGYIADTFDPLILGTQYVETTFGYQADRRCCFFEVFKNVRLLLVRQAVFLEFYLAF